MSRTKRLELKCRLAWSYQAERPEGERARDPDADGAPLAGACSLLSAALDAGAEELAAEFAEAPERAGRSRLADPLPGRLFGIPVGKTEGKDDGRDALSLSFRLSAPLPPSAARTLLRAVVRPPGVPCLDPDRNGGADGWPKVTLSIVPESCPALAGTASWRRADDPTYAASWAPGAAAELETPSPLFNGGDLWAWREAFFKKAAATLCGGDPETYLRLARLLMKDFPEKLECGPGFDEGVVRALKLDAKRNGRK